MRKISKQMNVLNTLNSNHREDEHTAELQHLVLTQAVWMLVLFSSLYLLGTFTLERFFILSYVGFLIAVHLFAPTDPAPAWWRRVQLIILLGFLGLCYFVVTRALEVTGV